MSSQMLVLRTVAAYGRDGFMLFAPGACVAPRRDEAVVTLPSGEVVVGPGGHELIRAIAAEKKAAEAARLDAHRAAMAKACRKKGTRRPLKRPRY